MLIALYLVAIVAANLTITLLGPVASIPTAFFCIGATLTLRDRLHDRWRGRQLAARMAGLVAAGALLSYLINVGAMRIALASFLAFAIAEGMDALVYHRLRHRAWWQRANGSNVVSAALDSLVFPLVAFGAWMPWIVVGQFLAKVAGGALWSALLARGAHRPAIAAAALVVLAAGEVRAQSPAPAPPRFVV